MEALIGRINQLENIYHHQNKFINPQQSGQPQFISKLPHNYNNNNETLVRYLDHLNGIDKNLLEILNYHSILGERLNSAIQNVNTLRRNLSEFLNDDNNRT